MAAISPVEVNKLNQNKVLVRAHLEKVVEQINDSIALVNNAPEALLKLSHEVELLKDTTLGDVQPVRSIEEMKSIIKSTLNLTLNLITGLQKKYSALFAPAVCLLTKEYLFLKKGQMNLFLSEQVSEVLRPVFKQSQKDKYLNTFMDTLKPFINILDCSQEPPHANIFVKKKNKKEHNVEFKDTIEVIGSENSEPLKGINPHNVPYDAWGRKTFKGNPDDLKYSKRVDLDEKLSQLRVMLEEKERDRDTYFASLEDSEKDNDDLLIQFNERISELEKRKKRLELAVQINTTSRKEDIQHSKSIDDEWKSSE